MPLLVGWALLSIFFSIDKASKKFWSLKCKFVVFLQLIIKTYIMLSNVSLKYNIERPQFKFEQNCLLTNTFDCEYIL